MIRKKKDDEALNFPTYSRGIDPRPTMNSFMYNSNLNDGVVANGNEDSAQ